MDISLVNVLELWIKGGAGELLRVEKAELTAGHGIEGDFSAGGRWQVSLISRADAQAATNTEDGLCTGRFWANIVVKELPQNLTEGDCLRIGTALCRIEQIGKKCFSECGLRNIGKKCSLADGAVFLSVETGGMVEVE